MGRQQLLVMVLVMVLGIACGPLEVVGKHKHNMSRREMRKEFYTWVKSEAARQKAYTTDTSLDPPEYTTLASKSKASSNVVVVDKNGKGDFKTVQAAVNSVKTGNSQPIVIQINAGTYKEYVKVPKKKNYITFQGAGKDVTKITWDLTNSEAGSTLLSASVGIYSDNFIAKDITFENSAPSQKPGAVGKQAVALMIAGDKAAFYRCGFLGYQDTLYDRAGRHYFRDCYIRGTIDFIFGDGQSLYENCSINPVATSFGSLTAQKRSSANSPTGFSFLNCNVRGTGMLYLARAWGTNSRVVFLYTYLADLFRDGGYNDFGFPARQKTVYYGEYQCYGPGADRTNRANWSHELTAQQAAPFASLSFIDGDSWVPKSA